MLQCLVLRKEITTLTASAFIKNIVCGILIGGGAILPGVSGGVLAVIFKIYQPMMELLSRPFTAIKKYWKLFLPIGIGWGIGFVGFAKIVGELFKRYEIQTLFIFIGLIFGTVPMLIKTGRKGDRSSKADMTALGVSFVLLLALLIGLKNMHAMHLSLNPMLAFVSGVIWGFSLVVPGLSSSSILLFMGLYEQIMSSVGAMQFGVIIPLLLGILLVALLFAKLVDRLFDRHFSIASHAVVGLVLASTLTIIPFSFIKDVGSGLLGLALMAVGFIAALLLDKWQNQKKEDANIK